MIKYKRFAYQHYHVHVGDMETGITVYHGLGGWIVHEPGGGLTDHESLAAAKRYIESNY